MTKRAHVPMRAMRLACLAGPAVVLLSGAALAFDTTKLGQGGSLGLDEMMPLTNPTWKWLDHEPN